VAGFKSVREDSARTARPAIVNAIAGHAVVERIADTGAVRDENPEVELVLAIDLPGRNRYRATHRQVLSRLVVHTLGPGTAVPVRVDAIDPTRLEIG
jgi:hypothetical protein